MQLFKCKLHQCYFTVYIFILTHHPEGNTSISLRYLWNTWTDLCVVSPPSVSSQTDEERQQALQAFTAQSFLGSPQQNTMSSSGSGASAPAFPSPTSSSEHKTKMKRGQRKNQNEKYRFKYLRLRKAARAMIFVSKLLILVKLWLVLLWVSSHILHMWYDIEWSWEF